MACSFPLEAELPESSVPCLVGIVELQRECEKLACKLSQETRQFLVYEMLKTLGPSQAQKLIGKFVNEGLITWGDDFEVESVLDHFKDKNGVTYYLIKWLGWGNEHNSWEPRKNLNCEDLLDQYHSLVRKGIRGRKRIQALQQEESHVLKRRRVNDLFDKLIESKIMDTMSPLEMINYYAPVKKKAHMKGLLNQTKPNILRKKKKTSKKVLRHEMLRALKTWEDELNTIIKGYDPAPLFVENLVDLEGPPDNFIYINERLEGPGIVMPKDPLIGCECEDCYGSKKSCCPAVSGSTLAYHKSTGRLRVPRGVPIFECNARCKCGSDCLNRVAQKGRRFKLCIFRTQGRGWGVKTLQPIKKGAFVVEYVGEVITNEEAERRGKDYDAVGRTYLFDLDFHDDDAPFSVDAGVYGNAAHFINHSCDPNLEVHVVWINTLDPRLPHICLYAKRNIRKNEELTFDYMSGNLMEEADSSFDEHQTVNSPAKKSASLDEIGDNLVINNVQPSCLKDDLFRRPLLPLTELGNHKKTEQVEESLKKFLEREKNETIKRNGGRSNDAMLTKIRDLPTPPCSDTESVTAGSTDGASAACTQSKFSMACLCGAPNCRKFLFF